MERRMKDENKIVVSLLLRIPGRTDGQKIYQQVTFHPSLRLLLRSIHYSWTSFLKERNEQTEFQNHQLVRLHALSNAEVNGKLARVKALRRSDGRYALELLQDGVNPPIAMIPQKCVLIKPINMAKACHHCHQMVVGQQLLQSGMST